MKMKTVCSLIRIIVISLLLVLLLLKTFMHITSCYVLQTKMDMIISKLYENKEAVSNRQKDQTEFDYRSLDLLKKTNDAAYGNAYAQAKCDGIIIVLCVILLYLQKKCRKLNEIYDG